MNYYFEYKEVGKPLPLKSIFKGDTSLAQNGGGHSFDVLLDVRPFLCV